MNDSVPLWGVLLAALSAFPIGSLWYSPAMFLKQWMGMVGATQEDMQRRFPKAMAAIGVASLLTAYIVAHFIRYTMAATGVTGIQGGLETAFWLWLGVSLTTIIAGGALEPRDAKIMVIAAGNRLVTLLVMGVIIGAFI